LKTIPETSASPPLRTDFTDDAAWNTICKEISKPGPEGFRAEVEAIDDKAFEGVGVQQILDAVPEEYPHSFIIVADRAAMAPQDRTLLVVNLDADGAGQHFRAVMSEMWAIDNNLSIANMDFADFANAVDSDGVHRGF
jgi:hypothetical protein